MNYMGKLRASAKMLETYGPEVEPIRKDGKITFTRAMMDSTALTIRAVDASMRHRRRHKHG